MAGPDIAGRVSALLERAGTTFGNGKMTCVLRKIPNTQETPWDDEAVAVDVDVTGIMTTKVIRDGTGMVARTTRQLLIDPTGPVPAKGDTVSINVSSADLTDANRFSRIESVDVVEPAGVVLLYQAELAD